MDDAIEQFWLMMKPELIKLKELVGSHKLPLVKIYSRILLLIYHNREYYDVVVSCQNYTALYQIVEIFQPLITASWSKYNTQDYKRALTLFSWEFAGRICCWGKFEKFDFDKVSVHARELAKLSENATQRLA
ncbi:hypothetical protein IKW75_02555 [Candidatus Saccharibacteria bacterium]|nr:hypothetical protein [Candidatus Saccharibacteria bacterium]